MSNYLGISAGFHDAGVSVVNSNGDILFAAHAERYSKKKNDPMLNTAILDEALSYGYPKQVAWYEKPWLKKTRQLYSGEYSRAFSLRDLPKQQLASLGYNFTVPIKCYKHHLSHAAAGFQTSSFDEAIVVVVDAIGEWDTYTAWLANYNKNGYARYNYIMRQHYPHSLGLFYSAMTKRAGLKPLEEEYILMGMAAYGKNIWYKEMYNTFVDKDTKQTWRQNLHTGVDKNWLKGALNEDIATATQSITEYCLATMMTQLHEVYSNIKNCVFMGGVALNCVANTYLRQLWDNVWIMPNPGDCGSSLGAAALSYGKRLNWQGPYLGTDIPGEYPCEEIISELINNKIVGVASGRAEFGPRALGNRSLLADPRGPDIKDKVNAIKRRQNFRPFAPMILKEFLDRHFETQYIVLPMVSDKQPAPLIKLPGKMISSKLGESPFMQYVFQCKHPDLFPAIVHVDNSSRVQTISKNDKTGARKLLEMWYTLTDCPMLLNTSLNIRGEPIVNDRADADRFEKKYGVKVCS
jgi:carbamoyltransferase